MDTALKKQLMQIAFVLLAIVIVLVVCKIRKLPIRETLGLTFPKAKTFFFWIALFLPIFVVTEAAYFGLGLAKGNVWEWEGYITVVRILKIGLIGPIVEELVFRGIFFDQMSRTKIGPIAAVFLTAIIFAASHFSYNILDILIILVHSLYWTWARYKTGSVLIPIVLHIFCNAVAIIEFLFINSRF